MSLHLRHLTAIAALAALAACGGKPADSEKTAGGAAIETDAEKVVNVYNWSDYIEPTVLEAFEKETGVKVNYEVMDANAMLENAASHRPSKEMVPRVLAMAGSKPMRMAANVVRRHPISSLLIAGVLIGTVVYHRRSREH
jgi:ABC-type glycerol-3-phosphate transport system substrate-binding protein